MRFKSVILLTLILCIAAATASAQDALRTAQIQAAIDDATDNLRNQLLQTSPANPDLSNRLSAAKQIGGPRWLDDHTCQVQLELDAVVASSRQSLVAVGSSLAGDQIQSARPLDPLGPWSAVDDASRKAAIGAAQQDAMNHLFDRLATTPLGSAIARPQIRARLVDFLSRQPVTRIDFADDLSVSLTIRPYADSVVATLHAALNDSEFKIDWKTIDPIAAHLGPAVGRAIAASSTQPTVLLPETAPDWINKQLQADATAAGTAAPLKIARAAESAAIAKLRDQFLALPIGNKTTLADALRTKPSIATAVDRAMQHARTFKVDYRADGSVLVRVTLNLNDAWNELRSNP